MAGGTFILEFEGLVGLFALNNIVASEFRRVGVEDEAVRSGRDIDRIIGKGFVRVEVEAEEQSVVLIGHELVAFVDQALLNGFAADDFVLADQVDHRLVEVGKEVELEGSGIPQGPLAAGILV